MSLTLIGSPISPFVRTLDIVLLERNLDFGGAAIALAQAIHPTDSYDRVRAQPVELD